MIKPALIIFLFFNSKILFAGSGDSLKLFIPLANIEFFSVDPFGNIYVVNKNNEVSCYSGKGELRYTYRSQNRNRIRSIDTGNPLKIMLFYDAIPEAVFLDRYLSETGALKFSEIGFQEIRAACVSSDNKLWIYDMLENSLCKIDPDNRKVLTRNRLSLQGFETATEIPAMKEYGNNLYFNYSGKEVYEFDFLGNKRKRLPISVPGNFDFTGDSLIYVRNDSVFFYNLTDYSENYIALPDCTHSGKIIAVLFSNRKIYMLKDSGIYY